MRKLRLALLGIVSIFCLNSCITSALIGTAVALCGENGCNNIRETKDKEFGIKIYEEKEPNRFKEYINSLNLRKRHKLEIQKGLSVNVPDGFILKKYSNGTFAASFMEEKTYPNRFPMKHGCYRFTSIDNGFHIESVKYDSTKEYGNLNNVVYTFDPTEL